MSLSRFCLEEKPSSLTEEEEHNVFREVTFSSVSGCVDMWWLLDLSEPQFPSLKKRRERLSCLMSPRTEEVFSLELWIKAVQAPALLDLYSESLVTCPFWALGSSCIDEVNKTCFQGCWPHHSASSQLFTQHTVDTVHSNIDWIHALAHIGLKKRAELPLMAFWWLLHPSKRIRVCTGRHDFEDKSPKVS